MLEFLVTNDDGIQSPGIMVLAQALRVFGKVTICCPDSERSGFSHSVTVNKPLVMRRQVDLSTDDIEVYTINGSPADTVKLGLQLLYGEEGPDYIFSGINAGLNVGHDAFYSGTIGAAREGVINGIPSVALSMEKQTGQATAFENLGDNLSQVIGKILGQTIPADTVINVNFPYVEAGQMAVPVKVVPLDFHSQKFTYRENPFPDSENGHYLFNDFYHIESQSDTDIDVVKKGMIAVSPLIVKPDTQALIRTMAHWFE